MCADNAQSTPPAQNPMAARMNAVARHLVHRCDGPMKDAGLPPPYDTISEYTKQGHSLLSQYNKTKDPAFAVSLGKLFEEYGVPYKMVNPPASPFVEAAYWYKVAAEAGNADGQFALGVLMRTQMHSVGGNIEDAIGWIKKAADQGHASAYVYLGCAFRAGLGVNKDLVEALACFQRALHSSGTPLARHYLAEMLEAGEGLEADIPRAVQFYEEAAEQGFKKSQFKVGMLYFEGKHVQKDVAKGIALIRAAAQHGYKPAIEKLSQIEPKRSIGITPQTKGFKAFFARMSGK